MFACQLSACWVQRPAARLTVTVLDKYLPRDSSCRGCSELACWTFVDAANQVSWVGQSACCLKSLSWENWAHTQDRTFPRASVSYHSGWSPARSSQWYIKHTKHVCLWRHVHLQVQHLPGQWQAQPTKVHGAWYSISPSAHLQVMDHSLHLGIQ